MADKISVADDNEIGIVTLVCGMIEGAPFWAYVAIKPSLYEEFMAMQKEDTSYFLPDYGEILEYSIGESDPSSEIRAAMEEKYGVNHNFEGDIRKMAKETFSDTE